MGNVISDEGGQVDLPVTSREDNEHRIVIIGPSASGKSTLFRLIKERHPEGRLSLKDAKAFISVIHGNVIQNAQEALDAANKKTLTDELANITVELENIDRDSPLDDAAESVLLRLWFQPQIREALLDSSVDLPDSTAYFFENIHRITRSKYTPTISDILRMRIRTSGIQEFCVNHNGRKYKINDLGGSRSERRKWSYCLESATEVVFMASLVEYDQTTEREDGEVNRLRDAVELFDKFCKLDMFKDTTAVLILNKLDSFEDKLSRTPLSDTFPEFKGKSTSEAVSFVKSLFLDCNPHPEKKIHVEVMSAVGQPSVDFIFDSEARLLHKPASFWL